MPGITLIVISPYGKKNNFWDATCVLWGHIPAAEYRKVIIGLIFLRYVSAAFDRCYQQLLAEGEGFENEKIIICHLS